MVPSMPAPAGTVPSSEKVSVCGGASASCAVGVKAKVWPTRAPRLPIASSAGGVLVTLKEVLSAVYDPTAAANT